MVEIVESNIGTWLYKYVGRYIYYLFSMNNVVHVVAESYGWGNNANNCYSSANFNKIFGFTHAIFIMYYKNTYIPNF